MVRTATGIDPRLGIILLNLNCAFDQPGWQGPNLMSSLRGVGARDAAKRIAGRRSIWEQALHAAYWKQRVVNKLIGTQPFPRRGSDWPLLPDRITERAWREDVALLPAIHHLLIKAVRELPPDALNEKMAKLLIGAAAHDAYHTGQVRLLRRIMGLARGANEQP